METLQTAAYALLIRLATRRDQTPESRQFRLKTLHEAKIITADELVRLGGRV